MSINPLSSKHFNHSWLYEQYVEHERSVQDIADECGVSAVAISKALRRSGIPARPFQGRVQPGAQTPTQRKFTEKTKRNTAIPVKQTPTQEDLRAPHLRPEPPKENDYLLIRADLDWLEPNARWVLLLAPDVTFQTLAKVTLAVVGEDFGEELCHYVVPSEGKPHRRRNTPFWRPTINDVIVPVVVTGDENYGEQLVGSDETPLSLAVGKGWTFWMHWNYAANNLCTFRVLDSAPRSELPNIPNEPVQLLAPPEKITTGTKSTRLSTSAASVATRIARALPTDTK